MMYLQGAPKHIGTVNIIVWASLFAIVYFFFLRPTVKKQKAQDSFHEELSKGQEVVTTSGIIGRVNKIEDGIIHLQIDQKTFIKVVKGAISKEMTESLTKKEEA